jgi:salicylate 5-hydroxylase small subunit
MSATAPGDAPDIFLPSHAALAWQWAVDQFNGLYAQALDQGRFEQWPGFFVPDALYQIQSRENHSRGLPLSLLALEGQGMMRDRVYGITHTIYHGPYTMRHVVSSAQLIWPGEAGQGDPDSETAYAVFRTRPGQPSEVYNVGRYIDQWCMTAQGLRLKSRRCIYDSDVVLNSLIYPI